MRRRTINSSPAKEGKRRAFALISALMAIVLLTVMVVAFISNSGTDRSSTNSYKISFLAEQGLEAGLEAAKTQLLKGTRNDHFSVIKSENTTTVLTTPAPNVGYSNYYYVATQDGAANKTKFIPLFAGADEGSSSLKGDPTTLKPPVTPPWRSGLDLTGNKLPVEPGYVDHSQTAWVDVNPDAPRGINKVRYTFWVQDLGGFLDAQVVGNQREAGTHKRTTIGEFFADEPALFTLFKKQDLTDLTTMDDRFIIMKDVFGGGSAINLAMRDDMPSPLDMFEDQIPAIKDRKDILMQNIISGLVYDEEQEVIPFYPPLQRNGEAKVALNEQVTTQGEPAVKAIADRISTAIPSFAKRRGAFDLIGAPDQDRAYLETLAASMIDYADDNVDSTSVESKYRGVDSMPFVNEHWDQYKRTNLGAARIRMDCTTWIEVWNPSNQPITGYLRLINQNRGEFRNTALRNPPEGEPTTENYGYKDDVLDPEQYRTGAGGVVSVAGGPITIAANGYAVIKFPTVPYTAESATDEIPDTTSDIFFNDSFKNNFKLYWGSTKAKMVMVDTLHGAAGGTDVLGKQNSGFGTSRVAYWKGSSTPPISRQPDGKGGYNNPENAGLVSDPRLNMFAHERMWQHTYTSRASAGVRNKPGSGVPAETAEVNPQYWPDRSYDTSVPYPNPIYPSTESNTPFLRYASTVEPDSAPAYISNAGRYFNIAELGNIFDPIEWINLHLDTGENPKMVDVNSKPVKAGGGTSLRIGRPEFIGLAKTPEYKASLLLDVLSVDKVRNTMGLVNINTANYDTLRALAVGYLTSDPKATPNNKIAPPRSSASADQADLVAKAIIKARPIYAWSQLASIPMHDGSVDPETNKPLQIFGEPKAYKVPAEMPTNFDDLAREELFRRVVASSTFRSRNFRIFVSAQVYSDTASGKKITSKASRCYQVFVNPVRNTDGTILSNSVYIINIVTL
jgi:hypothetical protein